MPWVFTVGAFPNHSLPLLCKYYQLARVGWSHGWFCRPWNSQLRRSRIRTVDTRTSPPSLIPMFYCLTKYPIYGITFWGRFSLSVSVGLSKGDFKGVDANIPYMGYLGLEGRIMEIIGIHFPLHELKIDNESNPNPYPYFFLVPSLGQIL